MAKDQDGVVQRPQRLGILPRQQTIQHMDLCLRRDGFGGVQSGIDPHHGLALGGQLAGFVFGYALGLRQFAGDLLIAIKISQIGRRRHDPHPLGAAFFGRAKAFQLDTVRLFGQALQIGFVLVIIGQIIVRARFLREEVLRRRDTGNGGRDDLG